MADSGEFSKIKSSVTGAFYFGKREKNSTKRMGNYRFTKCYRNYQRLKAALRKIKHYPKPTGHGTELVLSLSYDIVKAHGGELKVETKEGQGSEFIIQLPS